MRKVLSLPRNICSGSLFKPPSPSLLPDSSAAEGGNLQEKEEECLCHAVEALHGLCCTVGALYCTV